MKKRLLMVSVGLLMVSMLAIACPAPVVDPEQLPPEIRHPDVFITATIGAIETLDPAWAHDTASIEQIFNIYETLIRFKRGSTTEFEGRLATEWEISPDGLEYRFRIREGVRFHEGGLLTPEDVEYSIERMMVQDRAGGPGFVLLKPLLGVTSTRKDGEIVVAFEDIDRSVEVDGDWVVFRLPRPWPPFLSVLADERASIVDKEWAIEQGDWPGTEETWKDFNNPEVPPLQAIANGTGPFKLERWDPGIEIVLVRNDNYWREPAKLERVITKIVEEWTTRKLMFLAGDADHIDVPRPHIGELEGIEGITVHKNLPTFSQANFFFTWHINPDSPHLGSGKLDGRGIPPDFFTDRDVRLGFAHLLDYETLIEEALMGEGWQIGSPLIRGVPYHNPDQPMFRFDRDKAREHLKRAWGGQLWEKGMELTLFYNVGNEVRKTAADMLMWELVRMNPRFRVRVQAMPWPAYLADLMASKLPLFFVGWLGGVDPDYYIRPYMHSEGTFARAQGYSNPEVDKLIDKVVAIMDPARREEIYFRLQQIYHDEVISVPMFQALGRQYFRDWVRGWYHNPAYAGLNFYVLSKGY